VASLRPRLDLAPLVFFHTREDRGDEAADPRLDVVT
jgi:hypothetical protein